MKEQIEKQAIEEMARALCRDQEGGNNHIDKCSDCVCYGICIFIQEATRAYGAGYRKQSDLTPCDFCRFNPPSSADGKPCLVCPAQAKGGAE